ncbi:MAG TPA: helix-turn-helix domain-containing protein [Acidobacteriaceae bacterium]|nr:helix-turn-helix domain-containing protein [Acidobacteriaceae bacterium]
MKFIELHERLRLEIWRRIDMGVLSSALLARQTGLAQAHISNFLHRRRRLSLPALDRILLAQTLSVEDLAGPPHLAATSQEGKAKSSMDVVPIVSQSAAMTSPAIAVQASRDTVQLPDGWLAGMPVRRAVSRRSWERFVAVRIHAAQALAMDPLLRLGAIVIIDRHYNSLAVCRPPHPNIYGIRLGAQLVFRHVSFESSRLVLRPRAFDYPVELIELPQHASPSDLIVGRVCLCVTEV